MSSTDWKPAVGDVVRARTYLRRPVFPGRLGIVQYVHESSVGILWRSGDETHHTKSDNLKPAKPESLSKSQPLWVVKTLMNDL